MCAPDGGWRYHPKHVEQFSGNKLSNVSSHRKGIKRNILHECELCYTEIEQSAVTGKGDEVPSNVISTWQKYSLPKMHYVFRPTQTSSFAQIIKIMTE